MRKSVRLYLRLIWVKIRSQSQYRVSFLFDIFTTFLMTIIGFGSLALIFNRFGSIAGWSLAEVGFLFGLVETAFGLMDLLFSGFDPPNFGRYVRLGGLDQMLLRPVNITLQVLGTDFALRRLGRIFQGLVIFLLSVSWLEIDWNLIKIIYLPIIIFSLVCYFGGLFIVGSTITFWTVDSVEVVNILTYGGSEMISYPMHIYSDWMRRFFTYVFPAIFLNYYPALFILEKPDPFHMPGFVFFLAPVVGLSILGFALLFWSFGLKVYQSAGT